MALRNHRSTAAAFAILVTSACAAHVVPTSEGAAYSAVLSPSHYVSDERPSDTTSILKKLTKDVLIGSTVDTENGDKAPRALSIVRCNCSGKLIQGQLVVCNFENSAGMPGEGTTIEVLNPTPKSSPVRYTQGTKIKGCVGDALTSINAMYAAGLTSGDIIELSNRGALVRTYHGSPIISPFSDADALPLQSFSPEYIFVGVTTGRLVSISVGFYGNGVALEVAKGFGVRSGSQGGLAASGLQYNRGLDTLYIVDGVTNTVVAFSHASQLLEKDEIVVKPGGKTFKCLHPKVTCGGLVYSGSPLDAPMASALLPNGNLIVANTQGTANTLVELTPQGEVLDTKVIDTNSTQGVFGLAASGTNDNDTVLFYSDTNSNSIHELKQ